MAAPRQSSEEETMKMMEAVEKARDAMTVKRVFGEAYEKDGVTVIPAAWVAGEPGVEGMPTAQAGADSGSPRFRSALTSSRTVR
jgi:hypothetical protein